jgi:tartrate-resistant acid phosphatase type 5
VIGDYGDGSTDEAAVASLVASWAPDFVITLGDNNYPDGEATTIDQNAGQFYSQFIGNYQGSYGSGSPTNRFWPTLGNHDWHTITCDANGCNGAYFDYFTLPGNERYYEVDYGLVHLFAIDSDSAEPDGETPDSIQAIWLRDRLMASSSCFKVVFFHHAPYSSGRHGSNTDLQWPFGEWGADVVMAGHDHLYERLEKNTVPYIVNGSGGSTLYDFENAGNLPADVTSIVRYNDNYGAMLISADGSGMRLQFFNIDNELIDDHLVARQCNIEPTATNTPTNTATNTPTATPSDTPTTTPTETPTRTPTSTSTPSPTFSPTPSATTTNTPVVTLSDTPVSAATSTPTTSSLDSSVSYLPIVTADESALMTATEPGVAELFRIPPDNIVANLIERLASWLSGLYIRVTQS